MKKLTIVVLGTLIAGASLLAQTVPGAGLVKGPEAGEAKNLTGAGATFPAVLYSKWFSEYNKLTGVQVNYQSIGSGGGIKSISDMTVDFGATDGPMTDEQLAAAKGGPIVHIPAAMGAVVPTYNIPELAKSKDALKFTAETLAGIYLGEIVKWNDEKLVVDNPQLKNVNKYIVVARRSDGSGTTNIWTSYLTAVSETWAKKVGAGNSVQWPVGLGGKGNEGVAGVVKQTPYAIGYVELAYANQNKLSVGQVKNKAGKWITPTMKTVSLAAQGVALPEDMRVKLVNSDNPDAFPIAGFTWLLAYTTQTNPAKALALTRMLWWATHDGQKYCEALDYAPIPADAIKHAEVLIKKITLNGKQALPESISK
ncbi:phosphate ABC transporter substrate-binding protein PstS [Gracilinema caldarium]|uniref:phosphate ABC transporter substrate-binding protein PstS n=1 Tax=Gracilinema caldarium TaxID=215591 RepID=UPI0026EE05C7|nr:phosphate ABC transporter substrate-binding protein PstS [Gracilinema caldarium]